MVWGIYFTFGWCQESEDEEKLEANAEPKQDAQAPWKNPYGPLLPGTTLLFLSCLKILLM